jgi:hypothetical protein
MILIWEILNSNISTKEKSMPIFRKIVFGTGGPAKVRPGPATVIPRAPQYIYIYIEDLSDILATEIDDPLILE